LKPGLCLVLVLPAGHEEWFRVKESPLALQNSATHAHFPASYKLLTKVDARGKQLMAVDAAAPKNHPLWRRDAERAIFHRRGDP
jgi:hypothetical protein